MIRYYDGAPNSEFPIRPHRDWRWSFEKGYEWRDETGAWKVVNS